MEDTEIEELMEDVHGYESEQEQESFLNRIQSHRFQLFGKSVPTALAALMFIGVGAGAVLTYFAVVQTTVSVGQAVTVNGQSFTQGEAEAAYSYGATGGDVVENETVMQNHANQPAPITLSTTVSPSSSGVNVSYIVYDQWNMDSGTYEMSVDASEDNVVEGYYSLHFQSDGSTSDYARVWYGVSGVAASDTVEYTGVANGDNPLDDELWLLESDGDQFWTHGMSSQSGNTVTYDLDAETWRNSTGQTVTPDWTNVVAVGIGQGSPQSGPIVTDTYIDDVRVGGTSVDERASPSHTLVQTGDFGPGTSRYRLSSVAAFALEVEPGEYTIDSFVEPS